MAGEARLRGQSPAQEVLMRPSVKERGPRPGPPGPRPPSAQKKKRRP